MQSLYFQNLSRWSGERIDDVLFPTNIALLWSDSELATLGLYRAYPPDEIPEGKRVSTAVEWDGTSVRLVLEDIPPPPVPTSISPLQARKALRAVGLKTAVDAYVATLPEEEQEEWEYCTEVRRDNTIIAAGAAALGWSSEQLDDLFRLGATL